MIKDYVRYFSSKEKNSIIYGYTGERWTRHGLEPILTPIHAGFIGIEKDSAEYKRIEKVLGKGMRNTKTLKPRNKFYCIVSCDNNKTMYYTGMLSARKNGKGSPDFTLDEYKMEVFLAESVAKQTLGRLRACGCKKIKVEPIYLNAINTLNKKVFGIMAQHKKTKRLSCVYKDENGGYQMNAKSILGAYTEGYDNATMAYEELKKFFKQYDYAVVYMPKKSNITPERFADTYDIKYNKTGVSFKLEDITKKPTREGIWYQLKQRLLRLFRKGKMKSLRK